jgi:segregation and condensation protein A
MSEKKVEQKINQTQFFDLITGEEVSWQAIIYDLVRTEQLDPWDIDLAILAEKYALVIQQIEEANFYISSKVLLACALLLRLKSEILSNRFIQEMDEALYGHSEDKKYILERIELDENEIPILVPRTPMPRYKKVTLQELMSALNKAVETENRRINRDIKVRQAEKSALVVLPKSNRIPLKDRISFLLDTIKNHFKKQNVVHMTFSELAPSKEEKLASFVPILHLANNEKVYFKQLNHFEEIYMKLDKIQEEMDELKKELGEFTGEETPQLDEELDEDMILE